MDKVNEIINRVEASGLVTLDLEDLYDKGERVVLDIKDNLYQGLVLKEMDFRQWVKDYHWEDYRGKNVSIVCSADAIVPTWAYMLLAVKLEGIANHFVFGDLDDLENSLFQQALNQIKIEDYRDTKLVIKGCGDLPVPDFAYVEITRLLKPVAASIMYGEPCSTVPLYKRHRQR